MGSLSKSRTFSELVCLWPVSPGPLRKSRTFNKIVDDWSIRLGTFAQISAFYKLVGNWSLVLGVGTEKGLVYWVYRMSVCPITLNWLLPPPFRQPSVWPPTWSLGGGGDPRSRWMGVRGANSDDPPWKLWHSVHSLAKGLSANQEHLTSWSTINSLIFRPYWISAAWKVYKQGALTL